jgi:translation initiation factor 1A
VWAARAAPHRQLAPSARSAPRPAAECSCRSRVHAAAAPTAPLTRTAPTTANTLHPRRRRGKNENEEKRELIFKEDGQEYAQVLRMLGNGRLEAQCIDGVKRLCHIRGKMRKKVWVNQGDIVLVGLRDYQDAKGDVILKYMADEARSLKQYGELPENIRVNDTDAMMEGEENENAECVGWGGGCACAAAGGTGGCARLVRAVQQRQSLACCSVFAASAVNSRAAATPTPPGACPTARVCLLRTCLPPARRFFDFDDIAEI